MRKRMRDSRHAKNKTLGKEENQSRSKWLNLNPLSRRWTLGAEYSHYFSIHHTICLSSGEQVDILILPTNLLCHLHPIARRPKAPRILIVKALKSFLSHMVIQVLAIGVPAPGVSLDITTPRIVDPAQP